MTSQRWNREREIARLRERLWLHLTPAAEFEHGGELRATAAALLRLPHEDLRTLERLHFLLDDSVGALVDALPDLTRRLTTTTAVEQETSAERVRGPINWSRTIATQAATGLPHMYVTEPARRAYSTPENELLAFVLDRIVEVGDRLGWRTKGTGIGLEVARRVEAAKRWRHRRGLSEVGGINPTARSLSRIRQGRHHRRYRPALDAYDSHRRLLVRADPTAVEDAINRRGLVAATDPTLFEIRVFFDVRDAIARQGWSPSRLKLFGPARKLVSNGVRGDSTLSLIYQQGPKVSQAGSRYKQVLKRHGVNSQRLRPDFLIRLEGPGLKRWILGEVKLSTDPDPNLPVRRALLDLFAYRRDLDSLFSVESEPYGIGVGWGSGVLPEAGAEVLLCTPEGIPQAVQLALDPETAG